VVVAIASVANGRPIIVITANDVAQRRGLRAGELVRAAAARLGGGGGGRDDVAQGGGSDPAQLDGLLRDLPTDVGRLAVGP
jgi:alanyl-tRNA synthetase